MNSQFASDMIKAIEDLTSSFSTFTGGTITGGTWEGDAAENAKNQVTQKINPKAEAAKEKLNNLINAIQEAANAEAAKANMEELDRCIGEVNASDAEESLKKEKIAEYEAAKEKEKEKYDAAIEKVNSLCSN